MPVNFDDGPIISIKNFLRRFDLFLFSKKHFEQLGLFRFLLCSTLFYMACYRQLNIDQLGEGSIIPRRFALQVFPDFYRPLFQWFFWPDSLVGQIHFLLIILLLMAAVGLTTRPLLFFTWMIHQGMLNRNYAILFGADVIGGLFLFYLSFTNCAEFFSIKYKFFKARIKNSVSLANTEDNDPSVASADKKEVIPTLSAVFFRLLQIQTCTIYMYTGFEKLKGTTWWDGTALWTVFANPQFSQYDLKFFSRIPLFFAVGTFVSVLFEIYFPAFMINHKYRKYWLFLGLIFHLSIGLLLGLMTFSMIMLSTYVLFIDQETILKIWHSLKVKLRPKQSL